MLALLASGVGLTVEPVFAAEGPPVRPQGLPFTRTYPLDDIGDSARGGYLGFDARGRFRVSLYGSYWVLNDTTWIDLLGHPRAAAANLVKFLEAEDGRTYYGSRGSWGRLEPGSDGRLIAVPLTPPDAPAWTRFTSFDQLLGDAEGVVLAGREGIVRWEFATRRHHYHAFDGVSSIFRTGGRSFVAAHGRPLLHLPADGSAPVPVTGIEPRDAEVQFATPLDAQRTLLCLRDERLLVFDGERLRPWPPQEKLGLRGNITALQHLVDGGVALAIAGRGLYFVSPAGDLDLALTAQPYQQIFGLAANEPGVLWAGLNDSIEKILYGNPVTRFDQRLGLPLSWPGVVRWGERLMVNSSGELYASLPTAPGHPTAFRRVDNLPAQGAWTQAVAGDDFLFCNRTGVFRLRPDGGYEQVLDMPDVFRLAVMTDDLCLVLGQSANAVLRRRGDRWEEAAPRIPAAGYPAVRCIGRESVWIEYGTNKVARLSFSGGELHFRVWEDLPWSPQSWVNVGIIGDTVVLSGSDHDRLFIDDRTQEFIQAPALDALLNRSPHRITRMTADAAGAIWGTHDRGVVRFVPDGTDYTIDATTFDFVRDHFPFVMILPGHDVWVSTRRSLFHIDAEDRRGSAIAAAPQPALVSLVNERTHQELLPAGLPTAAEPRLPYEQNHLSFRFFAGTYAWLRPPHYEYRLDREDTWLPLPAGAPLNLSGLREGRHRLEVRLGGATPGASPPLEYSFEIRPPWYRTRYAYAAGLAALLLIVAGLVRWSSLRARRRNLVLERLVHERTHELETLMGRLREETRHSATLAERQRIAGEIHDSVQQGLSGLMLQLDSTLRLSSLAEEVRSRLLVARNMVSFTRQEVQNAVWDLESPLVDRAPLGDALRQLAAHIRAGEGILSVTVTGRPCALPSTTTHHLLRAAQEAITNAVRHAAARHITISVDYQDEQIVLTVADDGIGFAPNENLAKTMGHFGLRGLRSRAAKVGAHLAIDSAPGAGTRIRIIVPQLSPLAV